ncbi:MAG: multidrug effflux MFS transporter [Pseudonocardiales bacterium]|nr:multidrug effflux MFS transporter [Pseudonocardiales bacterium]
MQATFICVLPLVDFLQLYIENTHTCSRSSVPSEKSFVWGSFTVITSPTIAPVTSASRLRLALILGSLTAFAPMSIDLYLPAFPKLTQHFGIGQASVQLTLTACLAGLALGQLLAGPCSDAMGRRRPLLIGLTVYVAASVGCALAPSVAALTWLRLVQGLAVAAGLVIVRAIVRDLYSGVALARFFSLLMLFNGLAPILAPLIGSQLIQVMPWQGLFAVLAAYGVLLLIGAGFGLPETLPPPTRCRGGLHATGRVMRELLADRRFIGYALASGLVFAALFSYIAGSPFVLQQIYGLSPQLYGVAFGVNALGIAALGQLNGLLVRRLPPRRLLAAGVVLAAFGGVGLITAVLAGLGLPTVLSALFAVVASTGLVLPNATALILSGRPEQAGTASALLGVLQYLFGAVAAPLVGAFGAGTAVPMATLICGLTLGGLAVFALLTANRVTLLHTRVPEEPLSR